MKNHETSRSSNGESEFANFVIPGSERELFDELAEKMRQKASPVLGKSALAGEIKVGSDE